MMEEQPKPYLTFGFWVNLCLTIIGYGLVIAKIIPVLIRVWKRGPQPNPFIISSTSNQSQHGRPTE